MNMMGETYFNMTKQPKVSDEAQAKREFDQKINAAVEEVLDMLPSLLDEVLQAKAEELFSEMPACMARPDSVTRQVIDQDVVGRMLRAKCGNALGRGMNYLQK
ncbi:hypothetical protein [Escherichia coli]|uniref:hypothetical protein n=1 Tax=Escherichia coli TaxID=562 RepID=UPI0015D62B91|nr:hypothetical protein [Escherichia coli]